MFWGAIFVALAGLLTRLRPKSRRGRRRRLKVWRRRRYNVRSRPQRRQSASALPPRPETVIATPEESGSPDLSTTVSRRESASLQADVHQPAAGLEHSSGNLSVEKSTSSASNGVSSVREDEQLATGTNDSAKNLATDNNCSINQEDMEGAASRADSSVEEDFGGGPKEMVSSMKSVNDSVKCSQDVSKDSGYTGISVKSILSHLVGDGYDDDDDEYDDNCTTDFEVCGSSVDLPDTWMSAIVEEYVLDVPSFCEKVSVPESQPALEDTATENNVPTTSKEDDACMTLSSFGLVPSQCPETCDTDKGSSVDSEETDDDISTTIVGDDNDSDDDTDTVCEMKVMFPKEVVLERARMNGIALEEMKRTQDSREVFGTILVRNDCYEKEVGIRHSSNAWKTFEDTRAQWVETVEGGAFDRFEFSVDLPEESFYMELAFHYYQMWDNNNGHNYIFIPDISDSDLCLCRQRV